MKQIIKDIKVSDLVLWTENPRDPIDSSAKDQDIVDMAINDNSGLWKLSNLASQMGGYYDFSEIPIVVYEGERPVVYDGNRRVILAKIAKGCVTIPKTINNLPSVPDSIPCNVCDKDTAILSVLRKHGNTGSWRPLERDRFIEKYTDSPKSDFQIIEDATGIISSNNKMNQRFVKEEVFSSSNLSKLGIRINNGKFESKYNADDLDTILRDLCLKVEKDYLSTRRSRGNVYAILDDDSKIIIDVNRNNAFSSTILQGNSPKNNDSLKRRTKRSKIEKPRIFGKDLYIKKGDVNNLYRDICDLYDFFTINSNHLSASFTSLIRMSLRLLCETAAKELGFNDLADYTNKYFDLAKKTLSKEEKNVLAAQNVNNNSIAQLLHTGAHNYITSQNLDQTLAISIILGGMIQLSHNK